jgi:hypothetical protein
MPGEQTSSMMRQHPAWNGKPQVVSLGSRVDPLGLGLEVVRISHILAK